MKTQMQDNYIRALYKLLIQRQVEGEGRGGDWQMPLGQNTLYFEFSWTLVLLLGHWPISGFITDEGNWRLPKCLEKSISLWASASEQPKHESS